MNKEIMTALFPTAMQNVKNGKCPLCGINIDIKEFRDKISEKEYEISGICQKCQNEIFI